MTRFWGGGGPSDTLADKIIEDTQTHTHTHLQQRKVFSLKISQNVPHLLIAFTIVTLDKQMQRVTKKL